MNQLHSDTTKSTIYILLQHFPILSAILPTIFLPSLFPILPIPPPPPSPTHSKQYSHIPLKPSHSLTHSVPCCHVLVAVTVPEEGDGYKISRRPDGSWAYQSGHSHAHVQAHAPGPPHARPLTSNVRDCRPARGTDYLTPSPGDS